MNTRSRIIGATITVLLASGGGTAWWIIRPEAIETAAAAALRAPSQPSAVLPVPPVAPRVAEGAEYEACRAMLANDPAGARAYAKTWAAKGGGEGATHCLGLARIALGNPQAGAELLQSLANASAASPVARAAVYDQAAQAYLMNGSVDQAYAVMTLALSLSPDDPDLLTDDAVAAGNLGRYQDALDDLTHALEIDLRRGDALVLRASSWRHLNRLELAQDDIDRALAINPGNAEALLERGIIKQRRNDRPGARRDWQQAARLAPHTPTADLAQQNLALLEAGPERR